MKSLTKRLQQGDSTAFVELYDLLGEKLYRYVYARLNSSQDASDVVQEVFVQLVKAHRRLAKIDNLTGYVFTVARNETIRWSERQKRLASSLETTPPEVTCESLDSASQAIDSQDWVNATLSQLDDIDQEIIQLKVFSQLTFKEIAAVTQQTHANVASRYRRAILKLETQLTAHQSLSEQER